MSRVGRNIGELPVLTVQTISYQNARGGVVAEGDGDIVSLEAELEARC